MKSVFIYALNCPITGAVRYVGKTNNLANRFSGHLSKKEKTHKGYWIHSLLAAGRKPILEILDEVPDCEWPMWEVAYIQFFRDEGCNLVNGNDGGEGGGNPTAETRAKISSGQLGRKFSPETRMKMRAAKVGRTFSAEHRAKMSAASLGKPKSAEHNAKNSAALKGRVFSSEHCANMRASRVGKLWTSAQRADWILRKGKANASLS